MRQVYVLETFEDIRSAFYQVRVPSDVTPMIEEKAHIKIEGRDLRLIGSERFVLSESLMAAGQQFISDCLRLAVGTRFKWEGLRDE